MKDENTKEKFIELRGEGLSFDNIAKRIKVSKPTLIKWNKELHNQIEDLRIIRYEEVLEKYKLTKEKRIDRLSSELDKAWKAYEKKNYQDLSKRELLQMILRLEKQLIEETDSLKDNVEEERINGQHKIIIERIITNDINKLRDCD